MVGLLSARLFVLGLEENIIKAKKQDEEDSVWYRIKLGNGVKDFACTSGGSWKVEVSPGKTIEFAASGLKLFQEYDCTFDIDMSSGYAKVKLRTFKPISEQTKVSNK